MSYAQQAAPLPQVARPRATTASNIIPLRSHRINFPLYLTGVTASEQLTSLLRSPFGVYVTETDVVRDSIRVTFDVAPEDLDITLHMLITTLSEATIGAISHRNGTKVQ
jgi:hypothetical protein